MRKTVMLAGAVTLALGVSTTVAPSIAQAQMIDGPSVSWKLSLWGKRRAFTEGMEYISEQVKECSGGKFTIKLFYGEQLSKSRENLDGIKLGEIMRSPECLRLFGPQAFGIDDPFVPLENCI